MVYVLIIGKRTPIYGMPMHDEWVESVYGVYNSREVAEKHWPKNDENEMYHIEEHKLVED